MAAGPVHAELEQSEETFDQRIPLQSDKMYFTRKAPVSRTQTAALSSRCFSTPPSLLPRNATSLPSTCTQTYLCSGNYSDQAKNDQTIPDELHLAGNSYRRTSYPTLATKPEKITESSGKLFGEGANFTTGINYRLLEHVATAADV